MTDPFDTTEWEVSLHHGFPVGEGGDLVNEVAYPGYRRQTYRRDDTAQTVTFPLVTEEGSASYWVLSCNGEALYYKSVKLPLIIGEVPALYFPFDPAKLNVH